MEEWQQTQPDSQPTPEDMTSIWTQAIRGVNKGIKYFSNFLDMTSF